MGELRPDPAQARTTVVVTHARTSSPAERATLRSLARIAWRRRDPQLPFEELDFVGGFALLSHGLVDVDGRAVLSVGRGRADHLRPPFAAVSIQDDRATLDVDHLGFQHLYVTQQPTFSAASTSSLMLGAMARARLDETFWADLALLGFPLDASSPFEGVSKLGPREVATLQHGGLTRRSDPVGSSSVAERNGVEVVRAIVADQLRAHPDAILELSGGLDSRVILAAMVPGDRRGRVAVTIDTPGGDDTAVARTIAQQQGLDHLVVPAWQSGEFTALEMLDRVDRAARLRDASVDVLAATMLDRVDEVVPANPRFSGVNGEYVRGFYYPGTLPGATVNPRTTDRLVRWRLLTNQRATPALFEPDWLEAAEDDLRRRVLRSLATSAAPLRASTDDFYLHQRVVRWAGPAYSRAAAGRTVLAPFLDAAFIHWAAGQPTSVRADSRLLAHVLRDLDPTLAGVPLAGGPPPLHLASGLPARLVRRSPAKAAKFGRKVVQRVRRTSRPPAGAGAVAQDLVRAWSAGQAPFIRLRGVPFLDDSWLANAETELSSHLTPPTVSFLANLDLARRFLAESEQSATGATPRVQQGGARG